MDYNFKVVQNQINNQEEFTKNLLEEINMRNLKPVVIQFDDENPFTHCDTNNIITTSEEHDLLGMKHFNTKKTFLRNQAALTHATQFFKNKVY